MAQVYRVSLVAKLASGVDVVNTLHYRTAVDPPDTMLDEEPTPQAVADELASHLVTPYRAMLPTNATLLELRAATEPDPTNPNSISDQGVHAVNLVGTRGTADQNLAPWLGALLSFKTDHAGRSFRGRMFCPPLLDTAQLASGGANATASYMLAVQAFADALAQGMGGGSTWGTLWQDTWHARQVIYSRTRRARSQTPWWAYVISTRVDRTLHGLRSRKR